MKTKVVRWGNSLAVRIPRAFAEEVGMDEHRQVEISVEGKRIVLEATDTETAVLTLDDLLDGMTAENIHAEADWGLAVGREAR